MRVLLLVLTTVLGAAAAAVPAVELVQLPHVPGAGVLLALLLSNMVLVLVPAVVAAWIAYWPIDRPSPDSRRAVRRWGAGAAVVEVVGLAAFVVTGLVAGLTAEEIGGELAVALVVALALPLVGLRGLRRHRRSSADRQPAADGVDPAALRRVRRSMLLGGGIGLVVGLAFSVLELSGRSTHAADEAARAITSPIAFGAMGAGFGGLLALIALGQAVTAILGGHDATRRRIVRVVVRGKRIDLAPDEHARAARYAAAVAAVLPLRLLASGAILVGSLANTVPLILGPDDGMGLLGGGLIVLAVVIAVPLAVVQLRNIAAFRGGHPDPAPFGAAG